MNKKQQQTEKTKKRVAEAARTLFVQKGYKATSIEDIVAATGSSKGNIYYHFKSKEGLFLHLIDEWDIEWEQKWREKAAQYQTTVDKLFGMAEFMVQDDLNHPLTKAADEFFNNEEKTNEVNERIAEMVARHLKFNQELLQEGTDHGEFRADNVEMLAVILESLIMGLSQMTRRKYNHVDALTLYQSAFNVFLYGITKSQDGCSR